MELKLLFNASMLEFRRLVKLVIFYGEDLALSSWWSSLAGKISVYGIMDLVEDTATYAKRVIGTSTFGMTFTSCLYIGLFFFALILKCGGFHILGLGGRTLMARYSLLHLMNPAFMHIG